MALAITATLLTAAAPAPVQIVVTGFTVGDRFEVVGRYQGYSWPVPGGIGITAGTQIVLVDNRAPLNGAVYYTITTASGVADSNDVTVTYPAFTLLQSLDGARLAQVEIANPDDEREPGIRVEEYEIANRSTVASRWDIPTLGRMPLEVEAEGVDAEALKAMLTAAPLLVRRSDVTVTARAIPPVELLLVSAAPSKLIGAVGTLRRWALAVRLVGDPDPELALVAFDWADVDSIYAASTWTAFDAAWSASTWDQFDRYDWGQLL